MSYIGFFFHHRVLEVQKQQHDKSQRKNYFMKNLPSDSVSQKLKRKIIFHCENTLQFHRQTCKSCTKRMNAINKYNGSKANSKCFMYIDR